MLDLGTPPLSDSELSYDPPASDQRILWSDEFMVGRADIDVQHQGLVTRFNDVLTASASCDEDQLAELLERLRGETQRHFEFEESLMGCLSTDEAREHCTEHFRLLEEFGHLVQDWRDRHISAALLCRFLYRWLLLHIVTMDRPLAVASASTANKAADT